jgi:hypothetical protein
MSTQGLLCGLQDLSFGLACNTAYYGADPRSAGRGGRGRQQLII